MSAILDLNYEGELEGEVAERFFQDSVTTLQNATLEKEIESLKAASSAETDEIKRKEITKKLAACVEKKNGLKKNK